MPLISIIIPVFNNRAEDIKNCIESLCNDKYSDKIEIIVIDDGSCEECANVLDALPVAFSNVKVFHQLNQGVSNARNKGISFSSGKYIAFVDADDIVSKNFINDAICIIECTECKLDIIYGFVKYIKTNKKEDLINKAYIQNSDAKCSILTEKEKYLLSCHFIDLSGNSFFLNDCYLSRGPVARLVRKELAVRCKFIETLSIGEDSVWNLELLKYARHIGIVKKLWYFYIKNSASVTQTFSDKSIAQYANLIWKLADYVNDDTRKACLLNITTSVSFAIAEGYYSTNNFSGTFLEATKKFNYLFCNPPWNLVFKLEYALKSGWKCIIKYLLIKTGLVLFAVKFKKLIMK